MTKLGLLELKTNEKWYYNLINKRMNLCDVNMTFLLNSVTVGGGKKGIYEH